MELVQFDKLFPHPSYHGVIFPRKQRSVINIAYNKETTNSIPEVSLFEIRVSVFLIKVKRESERLRVISH